MTEEKFDPADHTAPEVSEELKSASAEEAAEIANAERQGKGRKSVLEAVEDRLDAIEGDKPAPRTDARGRELHPWEVEPPKAAQD